jgi:SET family sugar efflux transporter-like MFS transporter
LAVASPRLLLVPGFAASAASMFLAINAQAIAGSYMALFAVAAIGLTPLELAAFMTAQAASGIGFTWLLGRWLDRTSSRTPVVLALIGMILAYAALSLTYDKAVVFGVALIPLGLSMAAFPLIFAGAKGSLDNAGAVAAARGMAALRMMSSLAWAVGPAIAALLAAFWGYHGVLVGAAGFAALALGLAMLLRPHPTGAELAPPNARLWRIAGPVAVALTLSTAAMFMGGTAASIVTVQNLGGTPTDVGLMFSLCAAIEVPVMGLFVIRPLARASRGLLIAGFLFFVAYFLANLLLPGLSTLYASQALRAAAIGILSVVGMQYVQELMPSRPGAAAALFSNIGNLASLIAGLGAGSWAASFGYWSLFDLCAGMTLAGAAIVALFGHNRAAAPAT